MPWDARYLSREVVGYVRWIREFLNPALELAKISADDAEPYWAVLREQGRRAHVRELGGEP